MSYQDQLISYYLKIKQFISIYLRLLWVHCFNVKELKAYSDNQTFNVIYRYFIYNHLTYIINFFKKIQKYIDIEVDKIHVTKITEEGDKTIILEKKDDPITLEHVSDILHDIKPDESMLNCIFINFDLVNSDDEKICLKEYMVKYNDIDENHPHTLENIFTFNNISYSEDSKILVRVVKNRKISTHELPLKEVNGKHINYFVNL